MNANDLTKYNQQPSSIKKKRNFISLEKKLDILNRIESGERPCDIGRKLRMPSTTIRTIKSSRNRILQRVERIPSEMYGSQDDTTNCQLRAVENYLVTLVDRCVGFVPLLRTFDSTNQCFFLSIQNSITSIFSNVAFHEDESQLLAWSNSIKAWIWTAFSQMYANCQQTISQPEEEQKRSEEHQLRRRRKQLNPIRIIK
ncbi:hypothetical protein ACOME3_005975 [Neoechinorhynchus agilis]